MLAPTVDFQPPSTTRHLRRRLSWSTVLAGLAAALLLLPIAEAQAGSYQKGEVVQFTGLVTRADGQPISGVQVLLEAQREAFNYRKLRRTQMDQFRVSTTTDARGEFTIRWPWNDYYNAFELLVAIPVRRADGERLRVLTRTDVSSRVDGGSPVVVTPIVVADTSFLDTFRRFLASVESDDEKRVYQEQGRPDKVEEPRHGESAWWYFATGKVYRFRQGRLTDTESFDPIKPIKS